LVLSYAKEQYTADFRMGLARIRHNPDQIAMLHAEDCEERSLESQFEKIKRVFWEHLKVNKFMSIVGFILGQGSDLFPLIFLAHAYFTGSLGLGHFMRVKMAVGMIQDSMSWFIGSYATIAKFRAVSSRLVEMIENCEKVSTVRLLAPTLDGHLPGGSLKLTSAQGRLPTGTILWSIEDLTIEEGAWTLVQGSEGAGKSTLLKLLAGAWPAQEGTALRLGQPTNVSSPETQPTESAGPEPNSDCKEPKTDCKNCTSDCSDERLNMLFVPVGAYRLRERLRLKKAVCYPDDEDTFNDEEVVDVLGAVGLSKLLEAYPTDPVTDASASAPEEGIGRQVVGNRTEEAELLGTSWPALYDDHGDRMLSAGEAQRLELAHVLLTRPRWCFLDDPVSHVKVEERERLFGVLRERLRGVSTLVTITHDVTALSPLHDMLLELHDGQLRRVDDITEV